MLRSMVSSSGAARSSNKFTSKRRRVVLGICLVLLPTQGGCFHVLPSRCRFESQLRRHATKSRSRQMHSQAQELDGGDSGSVPGVLRDVVIEKIEELGGGKVQQVQETTAGPGLHNRHFKYTATGGTFMAKIAKASRSKPPTNDWREASLDNFFAEQTGLEAILETGCVRAPKPLALGTLPLGGSFLLMEHMPFIPFGQSIPEVLRNLAEGLAAMHLQDPPPSCGGFGFVGDNFLGGTRQVNTWDSDFSNFFVERRLSPQFAQARTKFQDSWGTKNEDFERIGREAILTAKKVLEPVANSKPALLHGDLWVGNCGGVPGEGRLREAAVFDPAVWYGLPEFDLALATMFGGFGKPFYETYHAIIPKAPGFERRMRVYKLYHYLNHLNLHGAGFGHGGTVEDPKGYYERSLTLMQEIVKDGFS
ncbi:unnamed protein product [Ectocarpus sp. 12 AP-2014]